jgi:hypothetical protein
MRGMKHVLRPYHKKYFENPNPKLAKQKKEKKKEKVPQDCSQ